MTVPVPSTSKMSMRSHTFISFDKKLCKLIFECLYEDFQAFLDKGLDPKYCLQADVVLEDESLVFKKGSPLIFIIIQCCTVSTRPWDLWMMMNLLLDRGVDLDKRIECEGGGEATVLEYACENAPLITEEILCSLLKAASSEASLAAIEKIKDPSKKESIKTQVFPERFPKSQILPLTFLEPLPSVAAFQLTFDEKILCHHLVEGNSEQLSQLLNSGLSPDYVLTQDVLVGDFVCKAGSSLLLLVLKACVENQSFFVVFENIALLLERGVNLEQGCLGTTPLFYICEHAEEHLEEVIVSFLSSVNTFSAFCALDKIKDPSSRNRIESALRTLKPSMFQREGEETIRKIKEELLASGEKILEPSKSEHLGGSPEHSIDLECFEVLESLPESSEKITEYSVESSSEQPGGLRILASLPESSIKQSGDLKSLLKSSSEQPGGLRILASLPESSEEITEFSLSNFFEARSSIVVNIEEYNASKASVDYGRKVNSLIARILCSDFSSLENILNTSSLLQEYNEEVSSLTHGKETLFSALVHKIKNPDTKHKICFLFLKHGFSKEEPVYKNLNLLSFLCSFRPCHCSDPTVLSQTIFLAIFYYDNGTLVEAALQECKTLNERKKIRSFFQGKEGNFSISSKNPSDYVTDYKYIPWIFAYLEISLLSRKDVITGEPLSFDSTAASLLNKVMRLLCNKSIMSGVMSAEGKRRILALLDLLEALLLVGIHPNCYKQENREKYLSFLRKPFKCKKIEIQHEVSFLIKKHWESFFYKQESIVYQSLFLRTFGNYTVSYGKTVDNISSEIENNNLTSLESLLKDPEALENCNQEVKRFNNDETLLSAVLHKVKDASLRHRIVCLFLKQGVSFNEVVYKDLTFVRFLCKLRSTFLLDTSKHLFLSTLCLALLFAKDEAAIKTAIDNCYPEDRKRLGEFFGSQTTESYSTKNISLKMIIDLPFYFPLTKAIVEASMLANENIITGTSWGVNDICPLICALIKKLSVGYLCKEETSPWQEKSIIGKSKLVYLYELLLIATRSSQFSPQQNKQVYLKLKNQMDDILWKDEDVKAFLLSLLNKHLPISGKVTGKRKGSFEEEVKEKKLKTVSIITGDLEK